MLQQNKNLISLKQEGITVVIKSLQLQEVLVIPSQPLSAQMAKRDHFHIEINHFEIFKDDKKLYQKKKNHIILHFLTI